MSAGGSDPPVGLLGLVTNTTSGERSATMAAAASMSTVKSGRRGQDTQLVLVPEAMIGCIEYDGSNPSADRPCPPNACNSCSRISLDPLAAHTFEPVSGTPVLRARYSASLSRSVTA